MTRFTRDELFELAPMHALGATTPEEAAAMEAAMTEDATLAAEVASFRAVPATLATAAPVAPSPSVRAALLAVAASVPVAAAPSDAPAAAVRELRAASRMPRWVPMLAAASLVIAVGAVVDGVRVRNEAATMEEVNRLLTARLKARESTLDAMLMGERELYLVQVGDPVEAQGPGLQFFWNAKEGKAVAHAFRLPPAPAGRDYQIWALVDGKPVSLVVFNSSDDGHALVDVQGVSSNVRGVTDILISVEPKGGSPQPTTAPFLGGKFPRV